MTGRGFRDELCPFVILAQSQWQRSPSASSFINPACLHFHQSTFKHPSETQQLSFKTSENREVSNNTFLRPIAEPSMFYLIALPL